MMLFGHFKPYGIIYINIQLVANSLSYWEGSFGLFYSIYIIIIKTSIEAKASVHSGGFDSFLFQMVKAYGSLKLLETK
jgi:hypothetical protein